jgi:hypothetical protein
MNDTERTQKAVSLINKTQLILVNCLTNGDALPFHLNPDEQQQVGFFSHMANQRQDILHGITIELIILFEVAGRTIANMHLDDCVKVLFGLPALPPSVKEYLERYNCVFSR